jgi:hypothetical protein
MPQSVQAIRENFMKECAAQTMKLNQFNTTGKDIGTWSVHSSNIRKNKNQATRLEVIHRRRTYSRASQ